jgi:hypothetical protein
VRGFIFGLALLVVLNATHASGDDYKDLTDAAYCIGSYQSDIEGIRRMYIDAKNADTRDVERKHFRKQAFVEGGMKQGKIDEVTASRMRSVGYADGSSCWERQERCTQQWNERTQQKVDNLLNSNQLANCNSLAEFVCERVYKNCE